MKTFEVYGRTVEKGRMHSVLLGVVEEKPTFREEYAAAQELLKKNGYSWGGWESRYGWRGVETHLDAAVAVILKGAILFP